MVRAAVTERVTHRPHPRATSNDTAHSGRCGDLPLTPHETTTTCSPGASTSNPRVAGSTPARRTNNDDDFASSTRDLPGGAVALAFHRACREPHDHPAVDEHVQRDHGHGSDDRGGHELAPVEDVAVDQ